MTRVCDDNLMCEKVYMYMESACINMSVTQHAALCTTIPESVYLAIMENDWKSAKRLKRQGDVCFLRMWRSLSRWWSIYQIRAG